MLPNKKILFVDDEERVLHGYRRMLRPENNIWHIFFANCAKDALHIMAREKVDLVLSDVMMPGTGGKELMAVIKKNWPFTPVIMITGKVASIEAAVEHIRSGACDYLTKPISYEKLKEAIKKGLIIGEESKLPLSDNRLQRRHLAGYEIMGHIDEGTTGVVFLAEKDFAGQRRQVALKILKSMDSIHPDERQEAIDRFAREGSVASAINHPNIVKILGYGIADSEKIPYIAMEYIEGMSLTSFMEKSRPSTLYQGLGIVCDIADALSAVHDQNICHRDVKPSNIIINKSGTALLTDFGLASLPNSTLTMMTSIMGSPAYMSPESFKSSKVDHRADIFSLGVVAYELLVGKLPFNAKNLAILAYQMQNPKPTPPRQIRKEIPEVLEKSLMKLLAKSPDLRYQHASKITEELRFIQEMCRDKNF